MAKKKRPTADKISFEDVLAELEEIVAELEEGQLGLDESLTQYERGVKFLKQCHRSLEEAEQKIQRLSGIDAEGRAITAPFDSDATLRESPENGSDVDDGATGRLF